jgi:hypothetical protein
LVGPEVLTQFLSADDVVAMGQEIGQQVEHLGAQGDECPSTAQLVAPGVEGIVAERVTHGLLL